VVQPQVTFSVTFTCLSPVCFYRIVVKTFESKYNLVLIRIVKFLESEELADSSWDDETALFDTELSPERVRQLVINQSIIATSTYSTSTATTPLFV
jgi:hypothetical protein